MVTIHLYTDDLTASTGEQFQRDAPCSREEIECRSLLEIKIAVKYIEDILLGKIRRRTSLERAWYLKMPTFVFSCDDSHLPFTNKVIRS